MENFITIKQGERLALYCIETKNYSVDASAYKIIAAPALNAIIEATGGRIRFYNMSDLMERIFNRCLENYYEMADYPKKPKVLLGLYTFA